MTHLTVWDFLSHRSKHWQPEVPLIESEPWNIEKYFIYNKLYNSIVQGATEQVCSSYFLFLEQAVAIDMDFIIAASI